jgi:hypothetical protein
MEARLGDEQRSVKPVMAFFRMPLRLLALLKRSFSSGMSSPPAMVEQTTNA